MYQVCEFRQKGSYITLNDLSRRVILIARHPYTNTKLVDCSLLNTPLLPAACGSQIPCQQVPQHYILSITTSLRSKRSVNISPLAQSSPNSKAKKINGQLLNQPNFTMNSTQTQQSFSPEELVLYNHFQSDPDALHRQMNLDNLYYLCSLAEKSDQDLILQIIAAVVATYIDANHAQITEYMKLWQFAWQTMHRLQTDHQPAHHFFGSILANILFHFYDKLPTDLFQQNLVALMSRKPLAGFTLLDAVVARFRPPHRLHKDAVLTLDSQHRQVKNQFYKHNLQLLLQLTQSVLSNDQFVALIDPAIEFFHSLLTIEFATDSKEKDWHKLKRAEIKNVRSLEAQIREFKILILEQDQIQAMLANSHLDWMDPTRSDIKKLWTKVRDPDFVNLLLRLLPAHPKIWRVLSKLCKILKKHFAQEQMTIELVGLITSHLRNIDLNSVDLTSFLKFSCKTLFADHSEQWVQLNLTIISKSKTIESLLFGLRFVRDLCRFQRQFDYSQMHQILMPLIVGYFNDWVLTNNEWQKDTQILKNVRYNIKVISHLIIESYLQYFAQIIQTSNNIAVSIFAFDYYLMGLFSHMKATSYQLDVITKLQFYKREQFVYPMDEASFQRYNYKAVQSAALEFAFKIANAIEQQTGQIPKFYYLFWKTVLDYDMLIRFEELLPLINIDRSLLFNFAKIFQYQDEELMRKSLKVLYQCKIRYMEALTFNGIATPPACVAIFKQVQRFANPKIEMLFYGIQSQLVNAENEAIMNHDIANKLLQDYTTQLCTLIQGSNEQKLSICLSILEEKSRCTYIRVMTMFWEQKYFGLFENFTLQHLKLARKMINSELVNNLRSEIIDDLLEIIFKLSKSYRDYLALQFENFNKERQIGQKIEKKIYQLYYKPIIKLLKLFQSVKHLNKCSTSKSNLKHEIYSIIFSLFTLINLNDINNYIHKMEPLYEVCQFLLQFETPRKLMTPETLHSILDFFYTALTLQERKTSSLVLKTVYDFLCYTELVNKQYHLVKFVIENCLLSAFIYNTRVKETGNVILRFLHQYPAETDQLFYSIKVRLQPIKSQLWAAKFDLLLQKLKQSIPITVTQDLERKFADVFLQFQMFYNYYP